MDGGTRRLLGEDSLQPGSRPPRLPPRRGDVLALRPSHGAVLFRPSAQCPCIPWRALATAPTFIPAGRLHGHRQLSTRPSDPPSPLQKTRPHRQQQTEVPATHALPAQDTRQPHGRGGARVRPRPPQAPAAALSWAAVL